jgi:hypothetical protein
MKRERKRKIMKKLIPILIVIFFVLLIGRAYHTLYYFSTTSMAQVPIEKNDSFALAVTDSLVLPLDSMTSPGVAVNEQYISFEGKSNLAFLNFVSRNIYLYDLHHNAIINVIHLDSLGFSAEDGVQGFCMIAPDSLLIYSYKKSRWTLIHEQKGKLAQGDMGMDKHSFLTVYPFVTTYAPMQYDRENKQVYFTGPSTAFGDYSRDKQRNVLISLNLQTGQATNHVNYPETYWQANWGGLAGFERLSYCLNPTDGLLVFSFMADHTLTIYNTEDGSIDHAIAPSTFFTPLKSFDFHPMLVDFHKPEIEQRYAQSFAYLNIVYDPYRKMYYRFTDFPSDSGQKQNSIILLTDRFERVGEIVLPANRYNINNYFVSETGFFIKRKDVHNDESLVYDCFQPEHIKSADHP